MRKKKHLLRRLGQIIAIFAVFSELIIFQSPDSEYGQLLINWPILERLYWYVAVGILFFSLPFILREMLKGFSESRYRKSDLHKIDNMKGEDFECYLTAMFKKKGYRAEHVGQAGDFGADIILRKGREKIIVQAKRYTGNVGIKAVQEVNGAVAHYNGNRGMVVTNSHFTSAAKRLAQDTNIELWDRTRLKKEFNL